MNYFKATWCFFICASLLFASDILTDESVSVPKGKTNVPARRVFEDEFYERRERAMHETRPERASSRRTASPETNASLETTMNASLPRPIISTNTPKTATTSPSPSPSASSTASAIERIPIEIYDPENTNHIIRADQFVDAVGLVEPPSEETAARPSLHATNFFETNVTVVRTNLQALVLEKSDIRFEYVDSNNFDLVIRKKERLESVMLVNAPDEVTPFNYVLRRTNYEPVNGDEIRLIEDQRITRNDNRFYLMDSTVEKDETFGEAFRIRVPLYSVFGKDDEVAGVFRMENGRSIVVRAFSEKHGSYDGYYHDNVFPIDVKPPSGFEYPKMTTELKVESRFQSNDFLALNIYYQDALSDQKIFMAIDSFDSENVYKRVPVTQDRGITNDLSALLIEAKRFDSGMRYFRIRLFVRIPAEDRTIRFNVFNTKGESYTYPIVYRIQTEFVGPDDPRLGRNRSARAESALQGVPEGDFAW